MSAVLLEQPRRAESTAVERLRSTRLVGWFAGVALVPMIAAHVIGAEVVNPLIDPISWYAFVPGGGEMIIAGAAVLAVLGLILTRRMYRSGLASGPLPGIAMIIFAIALVLVGVFPTDPPDTPVTAAATIHRVSAGAAFAVLPLVGVALDRSIRRPRSGCPALLRKSALLLGGLVATFLAIHLPLAMAGSGIAAFGFLERAGFVIMIGYLFLLARTVDQESTPTAPDAVPEVEPLPEVEPVSELARAA